MVLALLLGLTVLSASAQTHDRRLVQVNGQDEIYWVQNGTRYHVLESVMNTMSGLPGWGWGEVTLVSSETMNSWGRGPEILNSSSTGILVQADGRDEVWRIEGGRKRHVENEAAMRDHGYSFSDVVVVRQSLLNAIRAGSPITASVAPTVGPTAGPTPMASPSVTPTATPRPSRFVAGGAIETKWLSLPGTLGLDLGDPLSNETSAGRSGASGVEGMVVHFADGSIYWASVTGAREVHGRIWGHYLTVGGPESWLGYPTSDEESIDLEDWVRVSHFEAGVILWDGREAVAMKQRDFDALRWPNGTELLGTPVSPESVLACRFAVACARENHAGYDYYGTFAVATASGVVASVTMNHVDCPSERKETVANDPVPGKLRRAGCNDHGMGNTVVLRHVLEDGATIIYSLYAHLASIVVTEGQCVRQAGTLGLIGGTGQGDPDYWSPHLHFEIKTKDTITAPITPGSRDFGYTPGRPPGDAGYRDPSEYLGKRAALPCSGDEPPSTTTVLTPGGPIAQAGTLTSPTFGSGRTGSAVYSGGNLDGLVDAAEAVGAGVIWVQNQAGTWVSYRVNAVSDFVNNAFRSLFGGGFDGPTAITVSR